MTSGEQMDARWNLNCLSMLQRLENEAHCLQYPNGCYENVRGGGMANSVLHQEILFPSVTPSVLHCGHFTNFNDLQVS